MDDLLRHHLSKSQQQQAQTRKLFNVIDQKYHEQVVTNTLGLDSQNSQLIDQQDSRGVSDNEQYNKKQQLLEALAQQRQLKSLPIEENPNIMNNGIYAKTKAVVNNLLFERNRNIPLSPKNRAYLILNMINALINQLKYRISHLQAICNGYSRLLEYISYMRLCRSELEYKYPASDYPPLYVDCRPLLIGHKSKDKLFSNIKLLLEKCGCNFISKILV